MEELTLILFISIATPVSMMLFISNGRIQRLILFLLIGIVVCMFCSGWNQLILDLSSLPRSYYTANWTPFFEELFKALPVLVYAFWYRPKPQELLENALVLGIGFALLENTFILVQSAAYISLPLALIRGFGAGMMHGVCTVFVGLGMRFVHTVRKLFITGTVALLCAATVFHSIYNQLVVSSYQVVGFVLPLAAFSLIILNLRKERAGKLKN